MPAAAEGAAALVQTMRKSSLDMRDFSLGTRIPLRKVPPSDEGTQFYAKSDKHDVFRVKKGPFSPKVVNFFDDLTTIISTQYGHVEFPHEDGKIWSVL